MVGVVKEFEVLDHGEPSYRIVLTFERNIVHHLIPHPIIRDGSTKHIIQGSGVVQGSIRTWYESPAEIWKAIKSLSGA
jgi:hypothetical protein